MTHKLIRSFPFMFVGIIALIFIMSIASEVMASDLPRFLPAVGYDSGGTSPRQVVAADVNRDGILDLIAANVCVNGVAYCPVGSIGVLLGYGDGTFRPATTYRSRGNPSSIAVADLNNDGKPDLVVTNQSFGTLAVLLGKGDGTFRAAVTYSTGASGASEPTSAAVADVNGDGKPDVVVINTAAVNFLSKTVAVLLGNGDGTLHAPVAYGSGGVIPFSVAITDVNGDGKPDLLVANYHANFQSLNGTVGVLIGNGDGTFQSPVPFPSGAALGPNSGGSIAAADVNGDGNPDLLVANWCSPSTCPNGAVGVLLGNGDGSFRSVGSYASGGSGTYAVAVADVNSDGRPDLVVTNEVMLMWSDFNFDSTVGVLLGRGDGTFQPPVTYNSGRYWPWSVAIGDMNGDGNLDLAVVSDGMPPIFHDQVGVLMNIGGATTATSLVSSLNPSTYGQEVSWTASVATAGPTPPTGTVRFAWRYFTQTYVIGSATLNSDGVATFTKGNLNAGSYPMDAVYQGDPNSFFGVLRQVVLPTTSAATITSSLNPSTFGQAVTFTAKITSPTVTPSGPVTFTAGTAVLGTAQLSSGEATFTTSTLPAVSTLVQVTYKGNSNIKGSSASLSQTVQP